MESPATYLLRILRAHPWPGASHRITYLVIRRPYAHLEEELRRIGDVTVIVDRRARKRREIQQRVTVERRHAERRRTMEELGEMVIVNHGT